MPQATVKANSAFYLLRCYWIASCPQHCHQADISAWYPKKPHWCITVHWPSTILWGKNLTNSSANCVMKGLNLCWYHHHFMRYKSLSNGTVAIVFVFAPQCPVLCSLLTVKSPFICPINQAVCVLWKRVQTHSFISLASLITNRMVILQTERSILFWFHLRTLVLYSVKIISILSHPKCIWNWSFV